MQTKKGKQQGDTRTQWQETNRADEPTKEGREDKDLNTQGVTH